MKLKSILIYLTACLIAFIAGSAFALEEISELSPCVLSSHCARIEIESTDLSSLFQKSLELVQHLPRTEILDKNDSYFHAEVKTKMMRFVDDLEVKAISDRSLLQIRSESRVGLGDLGVNQRRINSLVDSISD